MAIDEIGASLGDFPSITDDSAHSGKQVGVEHLQMAVMQVPRGFMQGLTSLAKFCVRLIIAMHVNRWFVAIDTGRLLHPRLLCFWNFSRLGV
jgi:hypothetical protein